MKVMVVGQATLTAASVRTGRVSTVLLQSDSRIRQADGSRLTWEEALPHITEGDLVRVKGKRDREHSSIAAKRITILGAVGAAPAGG